jgi:hypothetical protein
MAKIIKLTESDLVSIVKKVISEQKSSSQKIALPQESQKIKSEIGLTGNFQKSLRSVLFSSGSKQLSLKIPSLRLSNGTFKINGTNVEFQGS